MPRQDNPEQELPLDNANTGSVSCVEQGTITTSRNVSFIDRQTGQRNRFEGSATSIAVRHRVFRGLTHIAAVCMRFREVMKTLTNMLHRLFNIGNFGKCQKT